MKKRVLFTTIILMGISLVLWQAACGGGDSSSSGASGNGTTASETFLSNLSVSPDGAFEDTATNITVRVTINEAADSVTLEEVSSSNEDSATVVETLATMYDDGDATTHGDDIAGDLVYSAIISVNEENPGFIYVRTNVDGEYSDIKTISVVTAMTSEQWTLYTTTVPDAVEAYFDANGADATVELINNGAGIDGVKAGSASTSDEGTGVSYVMDNGILGGIMANEPDDDDTETSTEDLELGGRSNGLSYGNTFVRSPKLFPNKSTYKTVKLATETVDEDAIQDKDAIYIGPYLWQVGSWDGYHGGWEKIKNSECPKFETTEVVNNASTDRNVTPETFKNLDEYGIIMMTTHGDTWYKGLYSSWDDMWGDDAATAAQWLNPFSSDVSWVVLLTNYKAADDTAKTYQLDLLLHRIAVTRGGTYAITPSFIRAYNDNFPESIVFVAACRSAYNQSMANAFLNEGAGAYIGFSDYVMAGFAKRYGSAIFGPDDNGHIDESLLPLTDSATGKTLKNIKEAYDDAVANYGISETTSAPHGSSPGFTEGAYRPADTDSASALLYPTDADKNLNVATIINGGFEEGSAIGWSSSGDYRVLPALGAVSPQTGHYMGTITTGLGTYGSGLTETYLSQTMCLPAGSDMIIFDYDFLSEEPMCYVNSGYDDTFKVELYDDEGNVVETGTTESVDSSEWIFLGGDYFSGGDNYSTPETCTDEDGYTVRHDGTYHTGWDVGYIDVSDYAGSNEPYTLKFRIYDQGDSIWDSAATIDDVELVLED